MKINKIAFEFHQIQSKVSSKDEFNGLILQNFFFFFNLEKKNSKACLDAKNVAVVDQPIDRTSSRSHVYTFLSTVPPHTLNLADQSWPFNSISGRQRAPWNVDPVNTNGADILPSNQNFVSFWFLVFSFFKLNVKSLVYVF